MGSTLKLLNIICLIIVKLLYFMDNLILFSFNFDTDTLQINRIYSGRGRPSSCCNLHSQFFTVLLLYAVRFYH